VARGHLPADVPLAYLTQTTLSVDDTAMIIAALLQRYPDVAAPKAEDICYATSNRQDAVKAIAEGCDLLLVIGAPNSSNSRRLVEVGLKAGAKASHLIQTAAEIDWRWFEGVAVGGLTAGASAPEDLVEGVIAAIGARFDVEVAEVTVTREDVQFKLPRAVAG
jgi:4-hydroxy-3-methylbut-2-enyl diphosphate reductase